MNETQKNNIATALREAYGATLPIKPIRDVIPPDDTTSAYAVQECNTEYWLKQGRRLVGRKIGLTSEAVQKQLGVDQPDYGMLFDDMAIKDGGRVDFGRLIQPKVEAEIALVLKKDLNNESLSESQIIDAIDYLSPSIEIVDSRIQNWDISFSDTVADNGSSALFVLGEAKYQPSQVDVVNCKMTMRCGGETVSQGIGAACLGSPYISALWLAQKMIEVGRPLQAGDIVLTGALGPMVPIEAGKTYNAQIEGLGDVSVSF